MKTWLCPWMSTEHHGNMSFGGSLYDLSRIGESFTADSRKLKKKKKG